MPIGSGMSSPNAPRNTAIASAMTSLSDIFSSAAACSVRLKHMSSGTFANLCALIQVLQRPFPSGSMRPMMSLSVFQNFVGKRNQNLSDSPVWMRSIASCFHGGRGGENFTEPFLKTPCGSVTTA